MMIDELLDDDTRHNLIIQLYEINKNQLKRGGKLFGESRSKYNYRPRLNSENLATIRFILAKHQYDRLHQLGKGVFKDIEAKDVKDFKFLKLKGAKQSIDDIQSHLNNIPEEHPHYAEAQFILAHLNYLSEKEESVWRENLVSSARANPDQGFIRMSELSPEELYKDTKHILARFSDAKTQGDETTINQLCDNEELRLKTDGLTFDTLFRLSVITSGKDQKKHIETLQTIDPTFEKSADLALKLFDDKALSFDAFADYSNSLNIQLRASTPGQRPAPT